MVVSVKRSADAVQDEEDLHAAAVAAYIVLLGAHARGLAGYWRTPAVLRGEAGRAAVGLPADERFVGLLYLGPRPPDSGGPRPRARRALRRSSSTNETSRGGIATDILGR